MTSLIVRRLSNPNIIKTAKFTNSAPKHCKTMSSDLQLKEAHLETHWNGRLLKLNYATLRKKLVLEPAYSDEFSRKFVDPIPSFVIRRRDMLEIEWEDGMIRGLPGKRPTLIETRETENINRMSKNRMSKKSAMQTIILRCLSQMSVF